MIEKQKSFKVLSNVEISVYPFKINVEIHQKLTAPGLKT